MADTLAANSRPTLRQVWQLPVLVVSVVLFGVGLYLSRPKVDHEDLRAKAIEHIKHAIHEAQFDEALEAIKHAAPQIAEADKPMQAEFQQLTGDALFLGQKAHNWSVPENHQRIINAYAKARTLGAKLEREQVERMAESYTELGQIDDAMKLLDTLGVDGSEPRQRIQRSLITAAIRRNDKPRTLEHIQQLLKEPKLTRANEVWAIARQAELEMRTGEVKQVIDTLLRRLARLQDDKAAPLGELMVQLGKAYFVDGDYANAERWMLEAKKRLEEPDPLNGEALVVLGKIRFAEENIVDALELFSAAVDRFAATPVYPEALIGKAECEARRNAIGMAMGDFEQAVKMLTMDSAAADPALVTQLNDSLTTQHELRVAEGDYESALKILELQQQLTPPPLPPRILEGIATAHEQIARKTLKLKDEQVETPGQWAALKEDTRLRTAEHYETAADYFRRYAEAIKKDDEVGFAQNLWHSADLYDRAGLHKKAIEVFARFASSREDDPRRATALYRLAQAYHAEQQLDKAVDVYQRVIDEFPKTPESYASLVPLARALVAKGPKFIDRAEHVLLTVVTDHPALRPESAEYRDALIELGQLYYQRGAEGDYEKAITRLAEVISRYGQNQELPELQFKLGDAYRKSVQQIDKKLAGTLQPSKRASLEAERVKRLEQARHNFDGVVLAYDKRDPKKLSELEKLYLRNSYFYRGDCAYDLHQFDGSEGAIALYEAAVQRYENDPASLVGLVQIVNSYGEMGKWDQARKANERAKVYLQRIPDEAFKDPNLPMTREHWQRWLDWASQLAGTAEAEK